jgi:DNA-binding LacI/PurR family transcriptional regulator
MATTRRTNTQSLSRKGSNRDFLYQQIAERLRKEIDTGVHVPGSRLPSMDVLAAHYEVNKITVLKALDELKSEGVIYSIPAQGTFVTKADRAVNGETRNKVFTVGVMSHVLNPTQFGPYHMGIIAGIQEELGRNKGNLLLMPAGDMQTDADMYRLAIGSSADAMIYLGPFHNALLSRLIQSGRASVVVDYTYKSCPTDTIVIDNVGGGYHAMAHLLELGHRKLAIVMGPEDQAATTDRFMGMMQALNEVGLKAQDVAILKGDFTLESGYNAGLQILKKHKTCTAVCCMNDEMAAGVLQAVFGKSSLKVPEDLSVIGFDDIHLSVATHPTLSSIHVDMRHMGRIAVQRLLDRIEEPGGNPSSTLISTQLVARDSTRPPAKA